MDKAYWTQREQAELALAQGAATPEARLIHIKLARRYGMAAGSPPPEALPDPANDTVRPDGPGR